MEGCLEVPPGARDVAKAFRPCVVLVNALDINALPRRLTFVDVSACLAVCEVSICLAVGELSPAVPLVLACNTAQTNTHPIVAEHFAAQFRGIQ